MRANWWERALEAVADRGRELLNFQSELKPSAPPTDLCRRLLSSRGEASAIALAREILRLYNDMSLEQRVAFFDMLESEFGPDPAGIEAAVATYLRSRSPADFLALETAVEPPRQELFRSLNMAPHGTASLVRMRGDLLRLLKEQSRFEAVDADLKHLLASWFNRGFLRLQRIDWHSPADILEKLIKYEAVHPIRGWDDLRRRLADDRCCFAFFHPAMPEEPLIFVEVALETSIPREIGPLLDVNAPMLDVKQADTAIFYSINNTQLGLRGISFGNFLIKQVLTELNAECTRIKHFATLSPMPRFRTVLVAALAGEQPGLSHEHINALLEDHAEKLCKAAQTETPGQAVLRLLDPLHGEKRRLLTEPLKRLALAYLTLRHPNRDTLLDPVAAFHLANGARLERINAFADLSEHGIQSSFGTMVNYIYDPREIETNHERFANEGQIAMAKHLGRTYKRITLLRTPQAKRAS